MPDPIPDNQRYNEFILAEARALRANDAAPANRVEWQKRRAALREALLAAMGSFPEKPCPLDARIQGSLDRGAYRVHNLIFQSRPDIWVTSNLYVPKSKGNEREKLPAVLCVHGHWAGARRDPVVQARCIGLVRQGFIVLAVDAFGAGERYTKPALGTYHGALYGSMLWPVGQTLLGAQLYDNRRAVDYLLTRDDVDGTRLGITGASGGGNQTMYAGALDERFKAVVPVCSVGSYQAYLKAACCVCEVLPGALRFTEEGDVLGLVAPRALLVISASRDSYQFSPGQAEISVDRAKRIFQLNAAADRIKYTVFDSGHGYSKPMRELMYGWMTQHLKGQGDGSPIAEAQITTEKAEDLACFHDPKGRPAEWLYLPAFAARQGQALVEKANKLTPQHAEDWESSTMQMRTELRRLLGEFPKLPRPVAKSGASRTDAGIESAAILVSGEAELPLPVVTLIKTGAGTPQPICILLHLDGRAAAIKHPMAKILAARGWLIVAPDLRATGDTKPPEDALRGAPDHNSAGHALWIGRPLLGQWAFDVEILLEWLRLQSGRGGKVTVAGIGQAGLVALTAAALFPDRIASVATFGAPVTLVSDKEYPEGTRMGLLVPGLLKVGDIPHVAAMSAPRRLLMADGVNVFGKRVAERVLRDANRFPLGVYAALQASANIRIVTDTRPEDLAGML
jgi:dienelactone hydrolase